MSDLPPSVLFDIVAPHVAMVTINRPDARNAVNSAVAEGIEAAVKATEANDDIWAVVLAGAGERVFCAGADLKAVAIGAGGGLTTPNGGFAGFVNARRSKVWIAAVRGLALAGGFEIALACDMIVASENSAFGLPEVKRGLMAAAGGVYRLPKLIPRNIALELIATGERLPARRAHELGLVNRLVPAAELTAASIELASLICENAPIAVRESIAVARQALDQSETALRGLNDEAMGRIVRTQDYQEGPRAFIEKRPPIWSGR